jgi:HNH endonuclease
MLDNGGRQVHRLILGLDRLTNPTKWLSVQGAVKYYAIDKVIQDLGDFFVIVRGGRSRQSGRRSEIRACSIIMIDGADLSARHHCAPLLTNRHLFVRDRLLCAYCGRMVEDKALTRDHIQPVSRGGEDTWMNCVACCAGCNHRKGNRRPEEAGMELLFAPYVPEWNEGLILSNRRILTDQMAFLLARVPERSRLRQSGECGTSGKRS